MKRVLFGLIFGLCFVSLKAQNILTIHEHPQKASYGSSSEWLDTDAQCHVMYQGVLRHIHMELKSPDYAEIDHAFTVNFTIKAFKWPGKLAGVYGTGIWGRNVRDIFYDGAPIENGDPNGLVTQTGHLTIDPLKDNGWGPWPAHGWTLSFVSFSALLEDGTGLQVEAHHPYWSEVNPGAPIAGNAPGGFPTIASHCQVGHVSDSVGTLALDINSYFPLAPFNTPYNLDVSGYTYAGSQKLNTENNLAEISLDADLHMGNEGTQIFQQPGIGASGVVLNPFVINPSIIGTGTHKLLFRWKQGATFLKPGLEFWSLLTSSVTIGDVPPPPPNPCETDPLTLSLTSNHPLITFNANGTDNRGCSSSISK